MACCGGDPVYRCTFCETQFEAGVADPGPDGEPRCPQCGLFMAEPVVPGEEAEFVVRAATPFR